MALDTPDVRVLLSKIKPAECLRGQGRLHLVDVGWTLGRIVPSKCCSLQVPFCRHSSLLCSRKTANWTDTTIVVEDFHRQPGNSSEVSESNTPFSAYFLWKGKSSYVLGGLEGTTYTGQSSSYTSVGLQVASTETYIPTHVNQLIVTLQLWDIWRHLINVWDTFLQPHNPSTCNLCTNLCFHFTRIFKYIVVEW